MKAFPTQTRSVYAKLHFTIFRVFLQTVRPTKISGSVRSGEQKAIWIPLRTGKVP